MTRLFYTHVNEDNRVEKALLAETSCKTLVAVTGSGERVIALLDKKGLQTVHAVDVNAAALFLLELKICALKMLSVDDYLRFCGHSPAAASIRINWFEELKAGLSLSCIAYWEEEKRLIKRGVIHAGHFERFLGRLRPWVIKYLGKGFRDAFHRGTSFEGLLRIRWNLLLNLFSFRAIYRIAGNKDMAFVSKDAQVNYIAEGLKQLSNPNKMHRCFMAHLIFKGNLHDMDDTDLPPSVRQAVLSEVKSNLLLTSITIQYHHVDVLRFITQNTWGLTEPVFYSLSDILSFEDTDYLYQLIDKLTNQEHVLVWRTFLRNRMVGCWQDRLPGNNSVRDHTSDESTGMYQVFSYVNSL